MESYTFIAAVAIILAATKLLSILSEKVHMPQVVGALLAGLILGPSCLNLLSASDFITCSAEIGVIILMFLAGLDTNLTELKQAGPAALVVALLGVILPLLGCGALYYFYFPNVEGEGVHLLKAAFIGVIMMATSVSITVETLRELGHLQGRLGAAILGAAVIDDILGIIALTVLTGFAQGQASLAGVLLRILCYFIFIAALMIAAFVIKRRHLIDYESRRVSIYGFAACLAVAWCSEAVFGVADITGAYFAGLIICNMKIKNYIAKKMTVLSYLFFGPIFFASIGIKTSLAGFDQSLLIFSLLLLALAVITKLLGCGLAARITGFPRREAAAIGAGMISRGEVALIVAQKGMEAGLVSGAVLPAIVLTVIATTILSPILLKVILARPAAQRIPAPARA